MFPVADQEPTPIEVVWSLSRIGLVAPLFHRIIQPLAESAPELLAVKPLSDALLAVSLVHWSAFANGSLNLPNLRDEDINSAWATAYSTYQTSRNNAISLNICGKKRYLWPFLFGGLRHFGLHPLRRTELNLKQTGGLRKLPTRTYLETVAQLLFVVARHTTR